MGVTSGQIAHENHRNEAGRQHDAQLRHHTTRALANPFGGVTGIGRRLRGQPGQLGLELA